MKTLWQDLGGTTGILIGAAATVGIALAAVVGKALGRGMVEEPHSDGTGKPAAYEHEGGKD